MEPPLVTQLVTPLVTFCEGVAVLGSIAAAATAIIDKASDPNAGRIVITLGSIVVIAVLIGFMRRRPASA